MYTQTLERRKNGNQSKNTNTFFSLIDRCSLIERERKKEENEALRLVSLSLIYIYIYIYIYIVCVCVCVLTFKLFFFVVKQKSSQFFDRSVDRLEKTDLSIETDSQKKREKTDDCVKKKRAQTTTKKDDAFRCSREVL